jgi:hypothetical protein
LSQTGIDLNLISLQTFTPVEKVRGGNNVSQAENAERHLYPTVRMCTFRVFVPSPELTPAASQIISPVFVAPAIAQLPHNTVLFECGVPDVGRSVFPDAAVYTLDGTFIVQEFEVKVRSETRRNRFVAIGD